MKKLFLPLLALVAVACFTVLTAVPKANAQPVTPFAPVTKMFSNAPTFIANVSASSATVNQYTWKSNAIPLRAGKGVGLFSTFNQASNPQAATVTIYYGLGYNRTNTSTLTNFSWAISMPQTNGPHRVFTNLPASVLDNADFLFWYATLNASTNTLTNYTTGAQVGN